MKDAGQIRECVQRVTAMLGTRPPAAKPDDPARAVWQGGLAAQFATDKPLGMTDMPEALGGEARSPSPGWYFRAGAAACLLSTIAMEAAVRGIALRRLEVEAHSESDARGMLGCGEGVPAGPQKMWLEVLLEADGADEAALQDLLAHADAHAPMSGALRRPMAIQARLRTGAAAGELQG